MNSNILKLSLTVIIFLNSDAISNASSDGVSEIGNKNTDASNLQIESEQSSDVSRSGVKQGICNDLPQGRRFINSPEVQPTPSYYSRFVQPIVKAQETKAQVKKPETTTASKPEILNERKASPPVHNSVPTNKNNDEVICIEKSKLIQLGNNGRRMNEDSEIVPEQLSKADPNNMETHPDEDYLDISRNAYSLSSQGSPLKCFACSNISNPYCNDPTNGQTTIKYCPANGGCVSKVVYAEGMAIKIRDCGNCNSPYTEKHQLCKSCETELCNSAFSYSGSSTLFTIFCGMSIILSIKLL